MTSTVTEANCPASNSFRVVVRCRPMSHKEISDGHTSIVDFSNETLTIFNPKDNDSIGKEFAFNAVYDSSASQELLYAEAVSPVVDAVLSGFNGTIFAYGQTGSGKTFTMEGDYSQSATRGMIFRSFEHIFDHISASTNMEYLVRVSYLEIYQEEIRDLLEKTKKQCDLRMNDSGVIYVKNLHSYVCKSIKEIEHVMAVGNQNRTVGATDMNLHSSRSHAIFIITIEMSETISGFKSQVRVGKLNLVDLAGSERQSKSKAGMERLKEASKINLSLSALGNVICALENGSTHVPYRDSKLTRLLQDSLGGNSQTLMIANIGPASYNYDESLTTLRYASRAKKIVNKPRINEDPKDALLREYREEILRLKALQAQQRKSRTLMNSENKGEMLNEEDLNKMATEINRETSLTDKERASKLHEIEEKRAAIVAEKKYAEDIMHKIESMESKLLGGGKNIIEHTNEQQRILEQQAAEIQKYKLREKRMRQELAAKEETAEEIRETFMSKQQEVEFKTRKLKMLHQKYQSIKKETNDIVEEFNVDRRELEMLQNHLMRNIKLNILIIDNFIPKEERQLAMSRLYYDEEEDSWQLMPDCEPLVESEPSADSARRLMADGSLKRSKRPSQLENIINLTPVQVGSTIILYEGPEISYSMKLAFEAALQKEEDIDVEAMPSTKKSISRYLNSSSGKHMVDWNLVNKTTQQPIYPKTRGLVPK
ncbi:kinesin-like protein KIF3B [Nilaparvata lugens]|uniref:kinesin-like protein KIF3B n=1 Tax=Nilaparvata lugens TaxID=108931 RepID=UPI00193C9CF0|nr:kinesin-like protein KIF3B [Nilaparvata lugens]XP_039297617.1 kinesin-like protein KIF3B [Nilaparvata lugens]